MCQWHASGVWQQPMLSGCIVLHELQLCRPRYHRQQVYYMRSLNGFCDASQRTLSSLRLCMPSCCCVCHSRGWIRISQRCSDLHQLVTTALGGHCLHSQYIRVCCESQYIHICCERICFCMHSVVAWAESLVTCAVFLLAPLRSWFPTFHTLKVVHAAKTDHDYN